MEAKDWIQLLKVVSDIVLEVIKLTKKKNRPTK